jgi:hypothetical protein
MANVCLVFLAVGLLTLNLTWMTTPQVGLWTLDNAVNNGTFMDQIEHLFHQHDIGFDHLDRKIMCFLHVLPFTANERSYKVVNSDLIAHCQNIVHVLHSFRQHHNKFDEVIVDGNKKGWFVIENNVVELPSL